MKNLLATVLLGTATIGTAQYNIDYLGRLDYQALRNSNISNLWGYTDEFGNEYAIVGVNGANGQPNTGGVSVVALGDGTDPQEIFFFPGPNSIWREVKVWGDFAYITTEAESGGITIVDLSPLPQSTDLTATVWDAPDWDTSHTLFIDENGRLYIHGADRGEGGVIMYDISDPWNPVEVGSFDLWYCHDSFARGDTLYAAHIYDGFFSIVDVADPANPVLLGTRVTPNEFTHNVWLDASGQHLFTTDERTNSYVGSYDVSDPSDIEYLDKLRSDNGSGAIPHNTYWLDHYLVTSYYTFGVTIYDAMRPHNLVEVGHYDTSIGFSGDGFNGAWGVYPFFSSQRLIISDIERGLFVLGPTYQRACWLEGTVRNAQTSAPVALANVSITGVVAADPTGIDGRYATGYHQGGTYTVQASAPGYFPATIEGVQLVQGEVTFLDIDLEPMVAFSLQGLVKESGTGLPVPNAHVRLKSPTYEYNTNADANGVFNIPAMFTDSYEVTAGQWGWVTRCLPPQTINFATPGLTIELDRGWYDDFTFDFGWTTVTSAGSGAWVRSVPVGTSLAGQAANPGADVSGDCGDKAYVTGNGGGGPGTDDLDDGNTVLTSPVFDLTGYFIPNIRYRRWFFNGGGSGAPNDRMEFRLSNGTTTVTIQNVSTSGSSWLASDIPVQSHIAPTATMRLSVFITDDAPGHVVEGGFDHFQVVEMSPVGLGDAGVPDIGLWPNPAEDGFTVRLAKGAAGTLDVLDATGRLVLDGVRVAPGDNAIGLRPPPGTYLVRIALDDGSRAVRRVAFAR